MQNINQSGSRNLNHRTSQVAQSSTKQTPIINQGNPIPFAVARNVTIDDLHTENIMLKKINASICNHFDNLKKRISNLEKNNRNLYLELKEANFKLRNQQDLLIQRETIHQQINKNSHNAYQQNIEKKSLIISQQAQEIKALKEKINLLEKTSHHKSRSTAK